MVTIKHKFIAHQIQPDTKTLIIGTFNPDSPDNEADFFYGRSRNYLWQLLPGCFDLASLKGKSKEDKVKFIKEFKIDFIDLIREVEVPDDQTDNYYDSFIDSRVSKWSNIIQLLHKHPTIKKVAITRKTFSGIPNMKIKILDIMDHCNINDINFRMLFTPARFYSMKKQKIWNDYIL